MIFKNIVLGLIVLAVALLYFLVTARARRMAVKYSALADAADGKTKKEIEEDHKILGKVMFKANCWYMVQTLVGIIVLFFPIWFACTELQIAYGMIYEGADTHQTFLSVSPQLCDCDDRRIVNETHNLSPDCAYSCSYSETIIAPNSGMKACTCSNLNGYTYDYDCIVPCGHQPFGYPYAEITYESDDLYCAIIDEIKVKEETRCKTIFGDEFPQLECPNGYDCFETYDKSDSCQSTCFWSAAKTTHQWRVKYRKGWTKYYRDPSYNVKGDSASAFKVDVHFGISGCKNGFMTLNGKVLCVDNIALLPNWLFCKKEEFSRDYLFNYISKDLYQSPGFCDSESVWERDDVQLSPFENTCSMHLTGTSTQCTEIGIMQCTKGVYESKGDYVTVHFPHVCKLYNEYVTSKNFTSCQGCNNDCTWSAYEGNGVNSTCSFTKYSDMIVTVNDLHNTTVHRAIYWTYTVVVGIFALVALCIWVMTLIRIVKLDIAYFRTRPVIKQVISEMTEDDYLDTALKSLKAGHQVIIKNRKDNTSRLAYINARTSDFMKLKTEKVD